MIFFYKSNVSGWFCYYEFMMIFRDSCNFICYNCIYVFIFVVLFWKVLELFVGLSFVLFLSVVEEGGLVKVISILGGFLKILVIRLKKGDVY